jgi:NADH-quinone oxidoreductase subunit G
MSCMTPAGDGTRISIHDPEAVKFRKSTIEWLMLNHPHDCPICDEGGECHLQDMTVMAGHIYRRTHFAKRTYRNQYLGPFVNHEMNRCIQCYRCVRFYCDHAGGRDLNVFACHDAVYFGRHRDGALESEFSGNLVEICPTGVFTDKTLKEHYTRKWDLQTAPSVCVHCGLGCNTIPGERYGALRRIRNRYNGAVNGYFLCDRGRYGYEFVNSHDRTKAPLVRDLRKKDTVEVLSRDDVTDRLSGLLYLGAKIIGIGSPRASLEANFALRTLVGPDRFYSGLSENELELMSMIIDVLQKGPARSASLQEVESCDAIVVLGEDPVNTAPMIDLALRQSVLQKPMKLADALKIPRWHAYAVRDAIHHDKGPIFIATPSDTKLDHIASDRFRAAPDDISRLGFAVAHLLDNAAPEVPDLAPGAQSLAEKISRALMEADRPLVVSGMSCGSRKIIEASANIGWALCRKGRDANLCFIVPDCNTMGLGLIRGGSLDSAFGLAADGKVDTAIILENDLYRRSDDGAADRFFNNIRDSIVIDCIESRTTSKAGVLLPAATFAEAEGTIVNNEGRAQRFFKVFQGRDGMRESWRWILDMMDAAEMPEAKRWKSFEDVSKALSESIPVFGPITEISPPAGFRIAGMKIPRQPQRYSGRTSIRADINVNEPKAPDDPDSPLSFSMEGYEGVPPSSLITHYRSPGWNSVQALNKFQSEVGGPLRGGDPGQRLIENDKNSEPRYFDHIPSAFSPRPGEFLVVPVFHIFGSEEFSVLSPGIAELAPRPYIGFSIADMDRLQVHEGEEADLVINGSAFRLPVKRLSSLPEGIAGMPMGLPGTLWISLPSWGRISGKKKNEEPS